MPSHPQLFTTLFDAALGGDEAAQKRLYTALYSELHRLAHCTMRQERAGHVLQTTALVHEAYMRLVQDEVQRWEDRSEFFKIAAGAMRRILVDEARRNLAKKRGGGQPHVPLEGDMARAPEEDESLSGLVELEALERALEKFGQDERHARKCHIVELRFFAGLTVEKIAEVLELSTVTVKRDWRFAKAWLRREIDSSTGGRHAG